MLFNHLLLQAQNIISQTYSFSPTDYCSSGSWGNAIVYILLLGTITYILSIITTQYSWIDRLWSLLPIIFSSHILFYQSHCQRIDISLRQWIMLALVSLWGFRLTYNFWRKGGYKAGGEDYRWAYIRKKYPRILVEFLNLFFTAYYQVYLIYLFSVPIKYAYTKQIKITDYLCILAFILVWLGQVIADEQQWTFQTKKYELLSIHKSTDKLPQPYKKGFLTSGLFSISRHPNFFCQMSIWWVIYAFSVSSIGWNHSYIGTLLLTLLFQGSTSLTEKISIQKYPHYKKYQNQVSRLIPYFIIGAKKAEQKEKSK